MSSSALYTPLSDKDGSEQEHITDTRSKNSLCDEEGLFSGKKRWNSRGYWYWIFYFGSVTAMSVLLVGIQQSLQNNQRQCWERFNYYCKRIVKLPLGINELKD